MINIVKMVETCGGCPSQWEGWDDEGAYYYFRYRWGYLRVDTAPTEKDWDSPLALAYGAKPTGKCETIYGEQIGDDMDGFMTYSDLTEALKSIVNLPANFEYPNYDEEEAS
jgi:hypothetical protein